MADAKVPDVAGLSSVVPHFHYDLIGRIAPGTYLVLCGYWIAKLLDKTPPLAETPSLAATIIVVGLFAYILGFIIGPVSHFVFDRLCRLTFRFTVRNTPSTVLRAIEQNGWEIPIPRMNKAEWHRSILSLSEQGSYVLWQRAPLLAIMTSRWDAEAFAARQFGTATIILIAITLWTLKGKVAGHEIMFGVLAGIVVLCYFQFRYSRRRAILSRFVMLASLAPDSPPDPQAIAARR